MNRAQRILSAALACAALASVSFASWADQVFYRWVDDRGQTVHSDRPPPKGMDYEVISTGSSFVREVASDEGVVPLDVDPTVGNEFDQTDTRKPTVERNPEFCQRARDNLAVLDSSVQIQMRDQEGNLRAIDTAQRKLQRQKAVDTVAVHCE